MSSTWRRYANGLVRDDLAAPDNGVNVNIRATLPRRTHTTGLRRSLTLTLLGGFGPPRGSYSKRTLQFLATTATLMHDKLAI